MPARRRTGSSRLALLGLALCHVAGSSAQEPGLLSRVDRLACGNTVVIAHASCYGATRLCIRETLTFHRPESRTIVAPHKHLVPHQLQGGKIVDALDYRISKWACVTGVNGGHYVAFAMARTSDGNCRECEYVRLYHPNGRLIATTVRFDAAGRSHEDPKGMEMMRNTVDRPPPDAFRPVYAQ